MADKRGVSLEALCLSLLAQEYGKQEGLIEPNFYQSLDLAELRSQVKKVIESDLPPDETRRRINRLEIEISRRYIL